MWFGFRQSGEQKADMTLPPGAPGHLEPEEGPVGKRKTPLFLRKLPLADPANNAPPNTPW